MTSDRDAEMATRMAMMQSMVQHSPYAEHLPEWLGGGRPPPANFIAPPDDKFTPGEYSANQAAMKRPKPRRGKRLSRKGRRTQ